MIPDEAVEAGAKVFARSFRPQHPDWEEWTEDGQSMWKEYAAEALEAAAPHLMAAAWERGYLFAYYQERGWTDDGTAQVPEHLTEYLAEWNPHHAR